MDRLSKFRGKNKQKLSCTKPIYCRFSLKKSAQLVKYHNFMIRKPDRIIVSNSSVFLLHLFAWFRTHTHCSTRVWCFIIYLSRAYLHELRLLIRRQLRLSFRVNLDDRLELVGGDSYWRPLRVLLRDTLLRHGRQLHTLAWGADGRRRLDTKNIIYLFLSI